MIFNGIWKSKMSWKRILSIKKTRNSFASSGNTIKRFDWKVFPINKTLCIYFHNATQWKNRFYGNGVEYALRTIGLSIISFFHSSLTSDFKGNQYPLDVRYPQHGGTDNFWKSPMDTNEEIWNEWNEWLICHRKKLNNEIIVRSR